MNEELQEKSLTSGEEIDLRDDSIDFINRMPRVCYNMLLLRVPGSYFKEWKAKLDFLKSSENIKNKYYYTDEHLNMMHGTAIQKAVEELNLKDYINYSDIADDVDSEIKRRSYIFYVDAASLKDICEIEVNTYGETWWVGNEKQQFEYSNIELINEMQLDSELQ